MGCSSQLLNSLSGAFLRDRRNQLTEFLPRAGFCILPLKLLRNQFRRDRFLDFVRRPRAHLTAVRRRLRYCRRSLSHVVICSLAAFADSQEAGSRRNFVKFSRKKRFSVIRTQRCPYPSVCRNGCNGFRRRRFGALTLSGQQSNRLITTRHGKLSFFC